MLTVVLALAAPVPALAGQPLETETARLLKPGTFELEAGLEHQRSGDGTETALPLAIEYGVSGRLELLVEPVLYDAVHDRGARAQTGIGDIEVTATTLLLHERTLPALALAGEVKIPTAENIRIGSGKTDISFYLIAGKRLGRWDTHVNAGYTFVGAPSGTRVNNTESFALAEEFHWKPRLELVAEVFGNTAALPEGGEQGTGFAESSITPEIGAAETVGTLGARYQDGGGLIYTLGLSYDNNAAVLVHPGITLLW